MSPRAACRLERFGFDQVYDYVAGIADWKAAGLPIAGTSTSAPRIADATRSDIPSCTPDESLRDARRRADAAGWDDCIVVDCDGIVVGRLRRCGGEAGDDLLIESAMEPGPTTVRPDEPLQPLVERMANRGTGLVVVTTPQGRLLGALVRVDAERLLTGEPRERIWRACDGCPGQWTDAPATSPSPTHP